MESFSFVLKLVLELKKDVFVSFAPELSLWKLYFAENSRKLPCFQVHKTFFGLPVVPLQRSLWSAVTCVNACSYFKREKLSCVGCTYRANKLLNHHFILTLQEKNVWKSLED